MATILRRIMEIASARTCSGSEADRSRSTEEEESSLGALDDLPDVFLLMVLMLLGPKDAFRTSLVCKSRRSLVSDDRLWIYFLQNQREPWESIFSETNLRLGGSRFCKYGWSKYESPSGRSATFLEFGNIESPLHARLHHFFATIYGRMHVRPYTQPIMVSIPTCHYDDTKAAKASRPQLKEAINSTLFEMNVPAICVINQATLSLYAAQRTSGISVNIGFQATSVVPILNGKVMHKVGVEVMGMGALKLTGFLRELMQQNNITFDSLYTVRTLKEKECYVAFDYEAEFSKNTQSSYEVSGEGWFTLSRERFQTGEILFQPCMAGVCTMGLHQAVALCMDHCHAANLNAADTWFKIIVLSGGTACLPGLAERLEKELHALLSPALESGIEVVVPPYGADIAWFGAKLISNLSTFPRSWCSTKKQFRRSDTRKSGSSFQKHASIHHASDLAFTRGHLGLPIIRHTGFFGWLDLLRRPAPLACIGRVEIDSEIN